MKLKVKWNEDILVSAIGLTLWWRYDIKIYFSFLFHLIIVDFYEKDEGGAGTKVRYKLTHTSTSG